MFYKILLSIILAVFISACTTTKEDTSDATGSGDATILKDSVDTTVGGPEIEPGSQEDLIVNVGDTCCCCWQLHEALRVLVHSCGH